MAVIFVTVANVQAHEKDKVTTTTTYTPGGLSLGFLGCWGEGYCTTTVVTREHATIMINHGDGTMTIKFSEAGLNEKNRTFYADKEIFINPEKVQLDEQICRDLDLPNGSSIQEGKSIIERKEGYLIIQVNIK